MAELQTASGKRADQGGGVQAQMLSAAALLNQCQGSFSVSGILSGRKELRSKKENSDWHAYVIGVQGLGFSLRFELKDAGNVKADVLWNSCPGVGELVQVSGNLVPVQAREGDRGFGDHAALQVTSVRRVTEFIQF